MRTVPLRWRLGFLTAIVVAILVVLMTMTAFLTVRAALYREVDNNLYRQSAQLLQSPYASEFAIEPAVTVENLKILNPNLDATFFAPGGYIARGDDIPLSELEIAVIRGDSQTSLRTAEGKRIYAANGPSGSTLILAQDLDPTRALLASLSTVLSIVGGAGVAAAMVTGIAVSTTGLRPLNRLTRATEYIARTDDLRPLPVVGNDELTALTLSFNAMLESLQKSRERQRELVADAGHELKTPMTSLRTNIELLMQVTRPGSQARISEQDRAELEADVIGQLEELSTLVGDLVDLAREDGPQQIIEAVDLREIVTAALERAERRRSDVVFDLQLIPWQIYGDPHALGRAMLNLLDNAAKWSPTDGTIEVIMEQESQNSVAVTVSDHGPGIPEEDRERVFERFYRAVQSRSMPGSGLGLAIVKQVIVRHGGTIVPLETPGGGATMRVTLPGEDPTAIAVEDTVTAEPVQKSRLGLTLGRRPKKTAEEQSTASEPAPETDS